jgi:hypothetical protein
VCAGHEVLIDIDENSMLMVAFPQGLFGKQVRSHSIHSLNITIIILITNGIMLLNC